MKYNFTDQVRQALARARDEAAGLQHECVGTEHILLGVIADKTVLAILLGLGVAPEEIRSAVEARVRRGSASQQTGELPYTSQAKRVLELAMQGARDRDEPEIGTEHLLLGILREEKGIGAEVLRQFGVTLENARSHKLELPPRAPAGFRVQIDDASNHSIYEQIVAQITEAVATGDLRPGERLPTVRQLADDLDVAPGTVARAYSELEREGLVVTEGVRGTRVAERAGIAATQGERSQTLVGLLRPVVVAAFHLGASAADLRTALEEAMQGIFDTQSRAA